MNHTSQRHLPHIRADVALSLYTTIGIGGPARQYAEPADEVELRALLEYAALQKLPVFILGGGSNILVSDSGWPGLVIRITAAGVTFTPGENNNELVRVEAGHDWDAFVAACVARNLQGIECLSGIPGSAGAAPIQNIGAYGQEISDTLESVEALDRHTLERVTFRASDCGFAYRMSRFKGADNGRYVVTATTYLLKLHGPPALRYGDLTRHFEAEKIESPTLAQVRDAVIAIRRTKGMVIDPSDPDSRSCGSFFTNPLLTAAESEMVRGRLIAQGLVREDDRIPAFPQPDGYIKYSAAWLMEKSGLQRGMQHGQAGLSNKHILAIINRGEASAGEVKSLVALIQKQVFEAFGVNLEPEPVFVT